MSNQQVVAPRISNNGFGPRRDNKIHSTKSTGIMNGGKLTNASPSKDRLMYVMMYLIGQKVDVHVKNGSVISGIFHTANDKDFGIVLKMAQITKDGSVKGQKSLSDIVKKPETMIIPSRELVQIVAKDVGLTSEEVAKMGNVGDKRKDLMIDSVISNSRHVEERELERWAPDGDNLDCLELEQPLFGKKWNKKWDQFETNEALFGVKSTFNEDIYTTKLVKGPHMKELEMHASRIAREIEGEDTDDLHLAEERGMEFLDNLDIDEELRYSAVTRDTDSWRSREAFTDTWRKPESQTDSWRRPPSDTWRSPSVNAQGSQSNGGLPRPSSLDSFSTKEDPVDLSTSSSLDGDVAAQAGTGTGTGTITGTEEQFIVNSNECDETVEKKAKSLVEENQTKDEVDKVTQASDEEKVSVSEGTGEEKKEEENKAKVPPTNETVNSSPEISQRPCSSTSNASSISRTSSLTSDKSSLNPNAKEFKFNPNARTFLPMQSNLRPPQPPPPQPQAIMHDPSSFYYQPNIAPVPHNMPPQMPMPMQMGGPYGGQQPFIYNPQTGAPMQQAYVQPNPPPYGQPMMIGQPQPQPQPRPYYYMQAYTPEMQYRGRNY